MFFAKWISAGWVPALLTVMASAGFFIGRAQREHSSGSGPSPAAEVRQPPQTGGLQADGASDGIGDAFDLLKQVSRSEDTSSLHPHVYTLLWKLSPAIAAGRIEAREAFEVLCVKGRNAALSGRAARDLWRELPPPQLKAAAEWLVNIDPAVKSRDAAAASLFRTWAALEPAAAVLFFGNLRDRPFAAQMFSRWIFTRDTRDALFGEESREEKLARIPETLFAEMVVEWDRYIRKEPGMSFVPLPPVPAGVLKALLAQPAGVLRDEALGMLLPGTAAENPEEAMTEALKLLNPAARFKAIRAVTDVWAERNTEEAARYLKTLPPGSGRDRAFSKLALSVQVTLLESAWEWAAQISDPALRLETQAGVLTVWRNRMTAEALTAFNGLYASLPDKERIQLTEFLRLKP